MDDNDGQSATLLWEEDGQMKYEGAHHMSQFANDEMVKYKFMQSARGQGSACGDNASGGDVQMETESVTGMTAKQLRTLIPSLVNAEGKKSFWRHEGNKPSWWPDSVEFRSPNHPKNGPPRMTRLEMLEVVAGRACYRSEGETNNREDVEMTNDEQDTRSESDRRAERDTEISDVEDTRGERGSRV